MLEILLAMALHLHGIPEKYPLAHCIVEKESNWQTDAVGSAGEIGLAQFMPSTASWFAEEMGFSDDWDPHTELYDPATNLYMLAWGLANGMEHHWSTYPLCR
jgi:soluble lytic murein transglycosylase-like protein